MITAIGFIICKIFSHNWRKIWTLENNNELWRCSFCGKVTEYEIGDLLAHRWEYPTEFGPKYTPVLAIGKYYQEITKARYGQYGKHIWWVAPEMIIHVKYEVKKGC